MKNYKKKKNELKRKNKEIKISSRKKATDVNYSIDKHELHFIKKMNKSPKGDENESNNDGNIIDVYGLTKTYVSGNTKYTAIKNANFSIKKGDLVVILGASGSGKSTLLNTISGLDRPTYGKIIVDNQNIAAISNSKLTAFRRRKVGFIFQSYNLLPSLNVKDNIEISRTLQIDNNKRMNIEEILSEIEMSNLIKSNIKDISGGQQQRVSIARAISKSPMIIFADEPTAALDSETSKKVIDLFIKLNKKIGTTIVIVTHDKNLANIADFIINVSDGEVTTK